MKVYVRKINSKNEQSRYKDNWKVITKHKLPDGKYRTKKLKSFKTKAEAEKFLIAHEKKILIDRDYDYDMSLSEFVDYHIRDWAFTHYKTDTGAKSMVSVIDRFVLPRVGHKQLDKITINDWESIWQDMNTNKRLFDKYNKGNWKDVASPDEPYSYQTIFNAYMIMCKVFKEAQRLEKSISPTIWLSELPSKDLMRMPQPKTIYNEDQYTALFEHLKKTNDRDYWFYKLMFSTGLRLGEALALTNGDIEFLQKDGKKIIIIHVKHSVTARKDENGFYKRHDPKSFSSIRKVHIPPKLTAEFMDYLKMIDDEVDKNSDTSRTCRIAIHQKKNYRQHRKTKKVQNTNFADGQIYYQVKLIDIETESKKTIANFETPKEAEDYIYNEFNIRFERKPTGHRKKPQILDKSKAGYNGVHLEDTFVNITKDYAYPICECSEKLDNCTTCRRIFIKEDGSQIGYEYHRHKLRDLAKELRLPDLTIHGMRHTHATVLIQSDEIAIQSITDRLGHASTSTTEDIYINTTDDYETKKAEKIDELF